MASDPILAARGLTDEEDRLLSADLPLAELQERCGGQIPGKLAIPELLDLVRQGREMGLRLAREFSAFDGENIVTGFVRINPLSGEDDGAVCELLVENWHREAGPSEEERETFARIDAIDRSTAELVANLDAAQRVLTVEARAVDLEQLVEAMRLNPGKPWPEYLELIGIEHQQPMHWRLLDGARCRIGGSAREWQVRLLPVGGSGSEPVGFELLLVANHPLPTGFIEEATAHKAKPNRFVGDALTPALRQPIKRIIANAETIKAKLAGPLRKEYADYAGNISYSGELLSDLLDDLADLEVVEAPEFSTARELVDLADAARRAGGIQGVKASGKEIAITLPSKDLEVPAIGEFRRVLQILLNLIGNAINYSPEASSIKIEAFEAADQLVGVSVSDNGPGLSEDQQRRVFAKFERLGRDGDGGSGLGLYISRRLALAMDGELTVESKPGQGARFTLLLPKAD